MSGSFSAGVQKGKGGPDHTVLTLAELIEPQELLPAVERQQKALTRLPTGTPWAVSWDPPARPRTDPPNWPQAAGAGSSHGAGTGCRSPMAHSGTHGASSPARAAGYSLRDSTWEMMLLLFKRWLKKSQHFPAQLFSPLRTDNRLPGWAQTQRLSNLHRCFCASWRCSVEVAPEKNISVGVTRKILG